MSLAGPDRFGAVITSWKSMKLYVQITVNHHNDQRFEKNCTLNKVKFDRLAKV